MFATINFCVDGNNMSRCHHTVSVTSEMANAIQKRIESNGSYNFVFKDGTELNQVIICGWSQTPATTMNHHGFLTRLLGIEL